MVINHKRLEESFQGILDAKLCQAAARANEGREEVSTQQIAVGASFTEQLKMLPHLVSVGSSGLSELAARRKVGQCIASPRAVTAEQLWSEL